MRNHAQVVEVLLAGPRDVEKEIAIVRDEITRWNAGHSRTLNAFLEPVHWDTHAFPEVGDRPQGVINRQIVDRCDLLIAVFWKTLGTSTGIAQSGTLEEIDRFRRSGKPVMIYFSEAAVPQKCDLAALKRLQRYKSNLSNALYSSFKSGQDFRKKLSVHLPQALASILRFRNSASSTKNGLAAWAEEKLALLNRIEIELGTTHIVNDFPRVIQQLRPILLEYCGQPRVSKLKFLGANAEWLIRLTTRLQHFSFASGTLEQFESMRMRIFKEIRSILQQAAKIELLDEWEIVRYEALKEAYKHHSDEKAWVWPDESQCQCEECKAFRDLRSKIGDNLNPAFRDFLLQITVEMLGFHKNISSCGDFWDWVGSASEELAIFEERFRLNDQMQNAKITADSAKLFASVLPKNKVEQFCADPIETGAVAKIEAAVTHLSALLGPNHPIVEFWE